MTDVFFQLFSFLMCVLLSVVVVLIVYGDCALCICVLLVVGDVDCDYGGCRGV